MTRRSRFLLSTAAVALAVTAGAWLWREHRPSSTPVDAIAASTLPVTADAAEVEHTDRNADPGMHAGEHSDGHDHGDEAPNVDLRARYFESPTLVDARNFAGTDTSLLIEASCRANPVVEKSGTAEQRLNALFAMNPRERFPEDVFYRSLIQFWRYEDQYYQLSAIWEIGLPPMYTLKLYRSPTPDFNGQVLEQVLPDVGDEPMDSAASAAYMARISDSYVAKGATLGLQILEADWPMADGKGRMRTTLANGKPVRWSFPGGACTYDSGATALRCRCPSAREKNAPATS
jgi:hypothetical protein